MSNRKRKLEFIDSYDEDNNFDGDFSKYQAVSLGNGQRKLINQILFRKKIKTVLVFMIYSVIVYMLHCYAVKDTFQAVLLMGVLWIGEIGWFFYILKMIVKDKCTNKNRGYRGTVVNKFYLNKNSERKYFVTIELADGCVMPKVAISNMVKKRIEIYDAVLIVPLLSIVVIPYNG